MAYFYSASQRAFYCTEIVSVDVMPADKVAVSDEVYKSLMAAQNAGKLIRPGRAELLKPSTRRALSQLASSTS